MNQCPKCNSTNTAFYMYGYEGMRKRLKKDIDNGEIILARDGNSNNKPDYHCNKCQHEWVKGPGEQICDTCLDVVMYCKCYEDVIKDIEGK